MSELTDYKQAKQLSLEVVIQECLRRADLYQRMTPAPNDPEDVKQAKGEFCIRQWHIWKEDRVRYLNDIGWAPDPRGRFGGKGKIPPSLAPPQMVPIILYPEQADFVREAMEIIRHDEPLHMNMVKSRQVAATTIMIALFEGCWRMDDGFSGLFSSYDEDAIDSGGKGQREADSMFGRLRMMVDAIAGAPTAWQASAMSPWAFNLRGAVKTRRRRDLENVAGMGESEDTRRRIVRPDWLVYGYDLFPGEKRNVISGDMPSDTTGKSRIFTAALMDEFGEYNQRAAGTDKRARSAVIPCCDHIFTQGTIPQGGGLGTEFHTLFKQGNTLALENRELDWSDVMNYMIASWYVCDQCQQKTPYGKPAPGPGKNGIEKQCEHCAYRQTVRREDAYIDLPEGRLSSPWFERVKASLNHDPVAIARYYGRQWIDAIGDRLFRTWDMRRGVVRYRPPQRVMYLEGFDPGKSVAHPAAWLLAALDCDEMRLTLIGYWIAAETRIEWWVPFIKRWGRKELSRMPVPFGKEAGQPWLEAYHYTDDVLDMLDRVSRYGQGSLWGDKYGSHDHMVESPYERLMDYGIHVDWEYTSDREALVRHGRDWASRMAIDAEIAQVTPVSPMNEPYPDLVTVFGSAKPKPHGGHGAYKLDVDKQDPPHVSHPVDAWLYLCKALPTSIHASVSPAGTWSTDPYEEEVPVFRYGGDRTLG